MIRLSVVSRVNLFEDVVSSVIVVIHTDQEPDYLELLYGAIVQHG